MKTNPLRIARSTNTGLYYDKATHGFNAARPEAATRLEPTQVAFIRAQFSHDPQFPIVDLSAPVTLKQWHDGEVELEAPIYRSKPYVLVSKSGMILSAGTETEIKKQAGAYYDDSVVDIRRYDLCRNDNSKLAASEASHTPALEALRQHPAFAQLPNYLVQKAFTENLAMQAKITALEKVKEAALRVGLPNDDDGARGFKILGTALAAYEELAANQ